MRRALLLLVGAICVSLVLADPRSCFAKPSPEQAQEVAESVSHQIMSPFCPGRLLSDCPSSGASDLKLEIQKNAESGMSSGEIVDQLAEKYGDEVRAVPGFSGFALLAWVVPCLFLGLGATVGLWWLWRNYADTVQEETDLCEVNPILKEIREGKREED